MAEYNNQSIDIDLEEMFNGLSDEDQEEFLVDMFQNLSEEETTEQAIQGFSCKILRAGSSAAAWHRLEARKIKNEGKIIRSETFSRFVR